MNIQKEIDVIIFVEHADRELTVSKMLKSNLEILGYSVLIGSIQFSLCEILLTYRPKAIITPFIGFGKGSVSEMFYRFYGESILYFNVNYEQVLFSFTGSYKKPKTLPALKNQINFCWGEVFKNFLKEAGVEESNLIISGRPYSQAIKEQNRLRKNIRDRFSKNYKLSNSKKWIFIALTDSLAIHPLHKLEKFVKDGNRSALLDQISKDKETISMLMKVIDNCNRDNFYEDFSFILRPHPSVGVNDYLNFFEENKIKKPANLEFIKEENAISWLISCDYYLTNYSTLIIDALEIKKPTFTLNSFETKGIDFLWPVNLNNRSFTDSNQLKALLNKKSSLSYDHFDNQWISSKDGINKMSEEIDIRLKEASKPIFSINYKELIYVLGRFLKQKVYSKLISTKTTRKRFIPDRIRIDYFPIIK